MLNYVRKRKAKQGKQIYKEAQNTMDIPHSLSVAFFVCCPSRLFTLFSYFACAPLITACSTFVENRLAVVCAS